MKEIILNFPKQFRTGFAAAEGIKISGNFNKILISGMGGSALAGEILKIWGKEKKFKIPIQIHRNYDLPFNVDRNTLIIAISYSGNTEETVSSFKKALKKKIKLVAITSGGNLLRLCRRFKIPVVIIPSKLPPRMAIGILFSALIRVLSNSKIIKVNEEEILFLEKKLKPEKIEKKGEKLARKLKGKIILIYGPDELEGLTRIWKQKFNENAKNPAFFNVFPEFNHGEMAGFENSGKLFHAIFLFDSNSHPRIKKREKLTAKMLREKGIKIDFIPFREKNILLKIFLNVILGDWTSYHLALFKEKDPMEIKIIEELKKKMGRDGRIGRHTR